MNNNECSYPEDLFQFLTKENKSGLRYYNALNLLVALNIHKDLKRYHLDSREYDEAKEAHSKYWVIFPNYREAWALVKKDRMAVEMIVQHFRRIFNT